MKKILIIGESCRDVFVYCHTERLAPDFPVPVLSVVSESDNPGMAKNVERNVRALHEQCDLWTNENWEEVTKTRYIHGPSNHMFVRVDTDHRMPRTDVKEIPFDQYDLIAISDYNKGFLTEEDIAYICTNHPAVFIDTKKILGPWAEDAKYIKINNFEYQRSKHTLTPLLEEKMIITHGAQGASFRGVSYPVTPVEVRDTSGAGDSFFAALLVSYAETEDIEKSIIFANACASEVVKHKGVSVIQKTS